MKDALSLKSKSGIHRLIGALEERGFIVRLPNKARALEIRKLPEQPGQGHGQAQGQGKGHERGRKDGNVTPFTRPAAAGKTGAGEFVPIPLYGKIAAGSPIEALRHETDMIDMPPSLLGRGQSYALTVEGDSMIDAGIMDGDIVVIEPCDSARDGDIVVAFIDEQEVTLKRLKRQNGMVALIAENAAYEPRILPPARVRVQGRLKSLFRHY